MHLWEMKRERLYPPRTMTKWMVSVERGLNVVPFSYGVYHSL